MADRLPWRCLSCGHELDEDEDGNTIDCPLPICVERRAAARRAMGVTLK